MTRFFNCQSDTANAIWFCSWRARNLVSVTEGRHFFSRATLQEGFTSESSSLTACVSISKLNGRASAKHFREVLRSADHCGSDLLPCEVKEKVLFLRAED